MKFLLITACLPILCLALTAANAAESVEQRLDRLERIEQARQRAACRAAALRAADAAEAERRAGDVDARLLSRNGVPRTLNQQQEQRQQEMKIHEVSMLPPPVDRTARVGRTPTLRPSRLDSRPLVSL